MAEKEKRKHFFLLIGNKALAGLSFVVLNFAVAIGNVSLINALAGVQYVFLFGMTLFLSKKVKTILEEEISRDVILHKSFAIALIGAGLLILSL